MSFGYRVRQHSCKVLFFINCWIVVFIEHFRPNRIDVILAFSAQPHHFELHDYLGIKGNEDTLMSGELPAVSSSVLLAPRTPQSIRVKSPSPSARMSASEMTMSRLIRPPKRGTVLYSYFTFFGTYDRPTVKHLESKLIYAFKIAVGTSCTTSMSSLHLQMRRDRTHTSSVLPPFEPLQETHHIPQHIRIISMPQPHILLPLNIHIQQAQHLSRPSTHPHRHLSRRLSRGLGRSVYSPRQA